MMKKLFTYWSVSFVVLGLVFGAVYLMLEAEPGVPFPIVVALAFSAAVLAILIYIDHDHSSPRILRYPRDGLSGFPGLIYHLLVERPSALGLFTFGLAFTAILAYYIISTVTEVEFTDSGFQLKWRKIVTDYVPLVATYDGWQNTNIRLKKNQEFQFTIIGSVSPGIYMGKDYRFSWDFTGPEGYSRSWYPLNECEDNIIAKTLLALPRRDLFLRPPQLPTSNTVIRAIEKRRASKDYIPCSYRSKIMTIKNLPHNWIVGIITDDTESRPKNELDAYDYEEPKDELITLSKEKYPAKATANRDGNLWIIINDTPYLRWDNSGVFLMSITRKRS